MYRGKDNDDYQGWLIDDDNIELHQFYYHPDHLGSSSYITNLDGEISQHIEYVPFGEVFLEEKNNVWNTPYKFNGKELDEETGLSYYGARYYDSRTSLWLSVDPLAEKYPNMSPYNYCANNPVKYIDPDGKRIIVPQRSDRTAYMSYLNQIWGEGRFSFENAELRFVGTKNGMTRKQKKALRTFRKVINASYDVKIKLSNFSDDESRNIGLRGGGYSAIESNDDLDVIGADVFMDSTRLEEIILFEKGYNYVNDAGKNVIGASTCPMDKSCGISHTLLRGEDNLNLTAPISAPSTIMHEVVHPLYNNKNQEKVIKFDNLIRDILGVGNRSLSDPEHNSGTE